MQSVFVKYCLFFRSRNASVSVTVEAGSPAEVAGSLCWAGACRAAEGLLKKVRRVFGEPRGRNEGLENELRGKLTHHKDQLDDARGLLREAMNKVREANRLSSANQENMTALEVSLGLSAGCGLRGGVGRGWSS